MNIEEIGNGPIESCPRCGYCLNGLPAQHTCPEGGLAYDRSTITWQAGGRPALMLTWYMLVSVIVLYAAIANLAGQSHQRARRNQVIVGGAALALGTYWTMRLTKQRRQLFVTTSPEGIFVAGDAGEDRLVPWDDLAQAEVSLSRWSCSLLRLRSGGTIALSGMFQNQAAAEAFARTIQTYARPDATSDSMIRSIG